MIETPELRFDVTKIISEIWGGSYVGRPFPNSNEARRPDERTEINDGLSHNGTNGVYYMTPTELNGWQLPLEPLMAINAGKKIVKTSLAGNTRRGTVKEIINTNDYSITLRGILLNEVSNDYPFDDVERLKELFEVNEAVTIVNALTKVLAIENVVITGLKLPEMVGMPNAQAYELNMLSDEDFVLIQE
jgi:hypothetical protein